MSKFLLLFIFLFCFVSSQNSTNETLNGTQVPPEDSNFTFQLDPFNNFDFGNLIFLDDSNATETLQKYDLIYVLFYAPWCAPCHLFLPTYVEISKYAEENNLKIKFAKIDAYKSPNMTEEFQIDQIPALFLIYKGNRYFFEGKRTQEAVLKFVDRKINNDTIIFNSLSQINEYVNSSYMTLLCTIKDKENQLYKSFFELSKVVNLIDFIVCTSDECIKEYSENIILFKEFDEKVDLFTKEMTSIDKATSESLNEFLGIYTVESGGRLTQNEINMMFAYKRNMVIYFRNSSDESQIKYDSLIKEIGLELRSKNIYAVTSDVEIDPVQEQIANAFRVLPIDLPVFLFYDSNANDENGNTAQLYAIRNIKENQLNKKYLMNYIEDIIAGKIKKTLFSEPPLDNYYQDGLKIIIGRNFDSDVIEYKNNVLLALTNGAVESEGTNRMLSIMKNLSRKYDEENDKIVFAFIDAQINEPRDVVISGHIPPIVILYTNAMPEKKKVELKSENFTLITEEEVENFLMKNLGWTQKKEYKKEEKMEEKKEEKKEIKEEKKEEIKEEKKINENKEEIKKEEKNEKTNINNNKAENDKIQTDL
jgi:protein disulfide-isomerase